MSDENLVKAREPFAPWLMEPMRRNRPIYIKVALAAVMINVFALMTSLFTMVVYDRVVPNNATSSLIARRGSESPTSPSALIPAARSSSRVSSRRFWAVTRASSTSPGSIWPRRG